MLKFIIPIAIVLFSLKYCHNNYNYIDYFDNQNKTVCPNYTIQIYNIIKQDNVTSLYEGFYWYKNIFGLKKAQFIELNGTNCKTRLLQKVTVYEKCNNFRFLDGYSFEKQFKSSYINEFFDKKTFECISLILFFSFIFTIIFNHLIYPVEIKIC